jgi:hypothetical protein
VKIQHRLSFFLAGTMQGSRPGADQVSQAYRALLSDVIRRHCPEADILCPLDKLQGLLASQSEAVRASHAALAGLPVVRRADFDAPLTSLARAFDSLSRAAGTVDVLIAYLPDHEASMGTAIEMWNAFVQGATVVAVTPMRQNLAVLSTSNVIVPSIDELEVLFQDGFLHHITPREPGPSPAAVNAISSRN